MNPPPAGEDHGTRNFRCLPPHGRSPAQVQRALHCRASTLEEVLIALAISALTVGGVAAGYVTKAKRAEWSSYSAAAQSAALQQVEQARTARWEPLAIPPTDELVTANFPVTTARLDLAGASGSTAYVTNRTTITTMSTTPPLRRIQVESVWSINSQGPFTNTVTTFRTP